MYVLLHLHQLMIQICWWLEVFAVKRTCLCCTECHGWIESNRIVYYRCKRYWNMHYWHTLIQESKLAFPVCFTVRWVERILILSLWFHIAKQDKMLMGIGRVWDAAGFSEPSLCSRRGTSFTPGQKLQAHGCLRWVSLSFFQLWLSVPVSVWLFQCEGHNCCISFAFFVVFSHCGGRTCSQMSRCIFS